MSRATSTTTTSEIRLATSEVSTCAHSTRRPRDRHGLEPLEDAALHVHEEPEGGVGDARGDRDEQDAGQQVVHVRFRPGVDRAAEDVDEQQHEGDRRDRGGDDGVQAARDVAQRPSRAGRRCRRRSAWSSWFLSPRCVLSVASPLPAPSPTMARKMSSRVGCFSTYSTLAGGSSCLSSARVPLTMIRPSCRIAIRSASCSASSRYCVVSSTVVPLPGELLDGLPHLEARLRVEPGGRLVEEDDRRVADQAHRDVEPAAHAARVGRHPRGRPPRSARSARAGRPRSGPGS